MMTREQFSAALDRYGSGLDRWPEALRQDARELTANDPGAAAELKSATRLDALLAEVSAPQEANAALIGRIVSHGRAKRGETVLQPTRRLAGWVSAAMVATLMIGFVAGIVTPEDQSNDAIAALLFSGAEEDIGEGLL